MIPRDLDAITKADIDLLVANAVGERRTIEYKQQLTVGNDEEKREFLADVSSFANAGGGDIIYGVVEKRDDNNKPTGIPERADGLAAFNADSEIRRLDDIILSGIEPRIPGYRIRSIEGFASGPVLLTRVPKSWAAPHMVTFKNLSRFFSRTSAGKYQLDVREIRSAFTASGDLRAKITAFRTERLGRIIANEGPISLAATPKIVLHLVPLTILDPATQFDLRSLDNNHFLVAPMQHSGYTYRFNLDGFLTCASFGSGNNCPGYVQVFRSGAFEAVDAYSLMQRGGSKLILSGMVEPKLRDSMNQYCQKAQQLGVPPPLVVMVSIHGVNGFAMQTRSVWENSNPTHTIDRDTLLLPDVLLEDFSTPAVNLLRPVFDAIWQSAGYSSCKNYDNEGRYDGGLSQLR